jgi:hypothetical protein
MLVPRYQKKNLMYYSLGSVNRNHALVDTEFPIISTLFFSLEKSLFHQSDRLDLGDTLEMALT